MEWPDHLNKWLADNNAVCAQTLSSIALNGVRITTRYYNVRGLPVMTIHHEGASWAADFTEVFVLPDKSNKISATLEALDKYIGAGE